MSQTKHVISSWLLSILTSKSALTLARLQPWTKWIMQLSSLLMYKG